MKATCGECNKVFDLIFEEDASELLDGHDCMAY